MINKIKEYTQSLLEKYQDKNHIVNYNKHIRSDLDEKSRKDIIKTLLRSAKTKEIDLKRVIVLEGEDWRRDYSLKDIISKGIVVSSNYIIEGVFGSSNAEFRKSNAPYCTCSNECICLACCYEDKFGLYCYIIDICSNCMIEVRKCSVHLLHYDIRFKNKPLFNEDEEI